MSPYAETTEADLQWWREKAESVQWTWAKTYAKTAPHWYVVLGKTPEMSVEEYERAGRVIRRFGKPGKFYQSTNVYLTLDGYRYWIMNLIGPQGIAYESTLINRADAEVDYGVQDAPDTTSPHTSIYDSLAVDYDNMWTRPTDLEENQQAAHLVISHFGPYAPRTLDIGCGTGLLLDLGVTSPAIYTGVDPSQGMLNELVVKHPKVKQVYPLTAEEYLAQVSPEPRSFELVTALFAACSYLTPDEIEGIAALGSRQVILMNYDGVSLPDYYQQFDPPTTIEDARKTCRSLLDRYPGFTTTIGAYDVTVLTP